MYCKNCGHEVIKFRGKLLHCVYSDYSKEYTISKRCRFSLSERELEEEYAKYDADFLKGKHIHVAVIMPQCTCENPEVA